MIQSPTATKKPVRRQVLAILQNISDQNKLLPTWFCTVLTTAGIKLLAKS
ncbi:MAG: hypothetical protein ACRCUY_07400 [Thermoguttaceae bacterium]